jgi:hypothetical protein
MASWKGVAEVRYLCSAVRSDGMRGSINAGAMCLRSQLRYFACKTRGLGTCEGEVRRICEEVTGGRRLGRDGRDKTTRGESQLQEEKQYSEDITINLRIILKLTIMVRLI